MGFFDFLSSPAQDPTLLNDSESKKKKKLPFSFEGMTQEEARRLSGQFGPGDPLEDALDLDAETADESKSNVDKLKVRKAHLDIQSAFGDALKAIGDAEQRLEPSPAEAMGGAYGITKPGDDQARSYLRSVHQRASYRRDPLKLADDLQQLGAQLKDNALISASQKLIRAGQAQAELEAMRKQGGPLAIDPAEVQAVQAKLEQRQQNLQQQLLTAGEIRTPQLRQELAATTKELARIQTQEQEKQQQPAKVEQAPPMPGEKGPVSNYMDGLGIDRDTLVDRLRKSMHIVGVSPEKWEDPVDPKAGLLRVLGALDPGGDKFVHLIAQSLTDARAQDQMGAQGAPTPGSQERDAVEETQGQIASKEAELKALYSQLASTPFMQTWPGIILYVLVGMITQNPAFAARLIGGVGNRDAIDREARSLQMDLRRYESRLQHRETAERLARQEAARRVQRVDDRKDSRVWELGKMMLQHKLILQRNAQRGDPNTPVMKKLSGDFNRASAMASKFEKTMNDPFASEEDRKNAKKMFDYYIRLAAELDVDLRGIGGSVLDEEGEAEE